MEIDLGIVFMILGADILTSFTLCNSARGMATEIGRNPRFYPKHYAVVPRKMKKQFGVRQSIVPKYLIFQYYMTIAHFYLGFIELLLYYCLNDGGLFARQLFDFH